MSAVYVILIICMCWISFGAVQAYASDRAEDVNSVSIWTVTSLSLDDHRYSCEPCAWLSEVFPSSPLVGPVTDLLYPDKRSVTTDCLNVISAELDVKIMLYGIWVSRRGTINKYTMFILLWRKNSENLLEGNIYFMTETFQFSAILWTLH